MEEYRKIPFLPGYECSNLGNIRNSSDGYVFDGTIDKDGYVQVCIRQDGKVKNWRVHQLVMICFVGPCPDGYCPDHKDRVRNNNKLENLQYITNLENSKQGGPLLKGVRKPEGFGEKISKAQTGSKHSGAKLNEFQVLEIRAHAASGMKQQKIADMYGIGRTSVTMIVNRKLWDHI